MNFSANKHTIKVNETAVDVVYEMRKGVIKIKPVSGELPESFKAIGFLRDNVLSVSKKQELYSTLKAMV